MMRDDKQTCNIEIKLDHCGNDKRLEKKDKRSWNDSLRHNKTSDDFYRFSEVKDEQSLRSRDNTEKTFRNKEDKS